ncbi:30S ribosomal protein S17 [Corynebacterium cystitidis]|uniref:30S ribosomal protein S17 n=1 Tax=Corynebacterium cystitidis TaxID=35757 RepID=UPI00211E56C3|nr:30S ribosomal protein S17 [Corynebacterium cystitidis]
MSEANVTETTDQNDNTVEKSIAAQPGSNRKIRRGYVVSDKMDKTIVVQIEDRKQHALYGKIMRRSKKYKAHDENNTAGVGDLVRIQECRPLSKDKHHTLIEIVEKAR